jgi:hypothetical protein
MEQKNNLKIQLKKTSRWLSLIGFIIAATSLFISVFLLFFKEKYEPVYKIEYKSSTNYIEKDIINQIMSFYKSINENEIDAYLGFYSDSIEMFYSDANISLKKLRKIAVNNWGKYPFRIDKASKISIQIEKQNNKQIKEQYDQFVAFVKISNSTNLINSDFNDRITEIRMNEKGKIIYIRDFIVDNNIKIEK